jgi:hypothetical protein
VNEKLGHHWLIFMGTGASQALFDHGSGAEGPCRNCVMTPARKNVVQGIGERVHQGVIKKPPSHLSEGSTFHSQLGCWAGGPRQQIASLLKKG